MYELVQSRLSRGENPGANYLEVYRSGHNGPDSKSPSANGSPSSEKPLTVRVSGIRPPQAYREF